ncbi:MAG: BatD family protein [Lishizhenia sp.]
MVKIFQHIFGLTLFVVGISVSAQNSFVSLEVSPLEVEIGEPVSILIKTDADRPIEFELPDEFVRAGGTQSGMSSSIDYSTKTVIQFSYQKFMGYFEEEGKFSVGPVKIATDKGNLKSLSYQITVKEPVNLISADPRKNLDQAIFGIIEQSKLEIYEGEPVVLSAKTYSQVNLVDDQKIYTPFEFNGPAKKYPLQSTAPNRINKEKIDGREVISFSVGKTLYYPEKSGTYSVDPFQLSLLYEDPNRMGLQRAKITSNKVSLTVKPLPNGTPSTFIGAVGDFSISSKYKANKLKKGEVFELIVTVKGKGNIHNIENPKLILPKGLVVYGDPVVKDSIVFSSDGASGAVELTYNIQALEADKYTIEPIEIAYFDTKSEKYKTVKSKKVLLNVVGTKSAEPNKKPVSKPKKENNQLKTILVQNTHPAEKRTEFYTSQLFWSTTSAPVLLGLLFGFFFKYRNENKDTIEKNTKIKSAKKVAEQHLNQAKSALSSSNSELFYLEIEKSIKLYIALKLGLTETEITRNTLKSLTKQEKISTMSSNNLTAIFDKCDQVRFGFESSQKIETETLALTENTLHQLDKELKK